jgi:hypothetical protein
VAVAIVDDAFEAESLAPAMSPPSTAFPEPGT